jgi:reticulon-4-interacting protein 1, mitochondrial
LSLELAHRFASTPFDAVIDCVGIQDLYNGCSGFLKEGKTFISTGSKPAKLTLPSFAAALSRLLLNTIWPTSKWLGGAGRPWKCIEMMDAKLEEKLELVDLMARGELKVAVDSVFEFEDLVAAYEKLAASRTRGKIVVRVKGNS